MIKTTVLPKDTVIELLLYIAENEPLSSVEKNLEGGVSVEEARAAIRELAMNLAREERASEADELKSLKKSLHLSSKTKQIISYLSPNEEKTLLSAFGLMGGK